MRNVENFKKANSGKPGLTKMELLEKIGCEFWRIYDDFENIFKILNPIEGLREGFVASLDEAGLSSVRHLLDVIKNRIETVERFVSEWRGIQNDETLSFNVKRANNLIGVVAKLTETVNLQVKDEPWFNSWQGEGNVYRQTQEAYKMYMETVSRFFAATDEEAGKSPGISKAPKVENVLDPKALMPK